MSEFGGLQKHEKTQHALVGLAVALLLWLLCSLIQVRRSEFPEKDNEVHKIKIKYKNY